MNKNPYNLRSNLNMNPPPQISRMSNTLEEEGGEICEDLGHLNF